MKRKFTVLIASLLLAVGWTNTASAQLLTKQTVTTPKVHASVFGKGVSNKVPFKNKAIMELVDEQVQAATHGSIIELPIPIPGDGSMLRAPRRATYNETADKTLTYAEYEQFTYNWIDSNGASHTAKLTDPVTDPYQMPYLVGSTYINPEIPGIKYTEVYQIDHPYFNIERGYDIPTNSRWYIGSGNSNPVGNITIAMDNGNLSFQTIKVKSGNTVLTEWSYASNGTSLPASWSTTKTFTAESTSSCYMSGGGTITINASLLQGATDVTVEIYGRHDPDYSTDVVITVAGSTGTSSSQTLTQSNNSEWATFTWNVLGTSSSTASSVTPPYDNGYTVFLVKVKDGVTYDDDDNFTSSWSDVVSYFNKYIDGIELLTDGVRVGGTTSNAGTVFTYTGNLNRFYFISKGKLAPMSSNGTSSSNSASSTAYDVAPFYGMYEEFSPTSTDAGATTTDFFEKMDQGDAYSIIHDCQGVNMMEHYFCMSGKTGTDHHTLTNLVFYIPDDRGKNLDRNYDHQPRVGLYTAELEANAKANPTQEHVYDVTINWETSLQKILGYDEPETHDLWVVVKDEQGNVVLDSLLTTTPDTTYTYQVPQYPESYTIDYIVRAWPTAAPVPVDHDANSEGTFYADSDPDDVLIPGYKDFISIVRHHYESDFDIDNEYNYYRNFMMLGNQNGTAGLTTARIDRGENVLHLFRYDYDHPEQGETEAATLSFEHVGDMVNWNVVYHDQQYYMGHTPTNKYQLPIMQIDTCGSFAVGSTGGGSTTTSRDVSFTGTYSSSTVNTMTSDGVTLYTSSGDLGYSNYVRLNGTTTVSTDEGTITKIVFTGSDTSYPVTRLSTTTGSYTTSNNVGTWTGSASSVSFTSTSRAHCSTVVVTVETTTGGSGSGSTVAYDTTYVLVDSINFVYDCVQTTGNFTVNHGNWSSPSNSMYMTSSGAAYIRYGSSSSTAWTYYLQYNAPAELANETLAFNFGVIDNSTYGSYIASEENSSGYLDGIVQASDTYRYYTLFTEPLGNGGNVMFYGVTPSTTTSGQWTNYYSPTIYHVYVYKQVLTEINSEDVPIDVSGIQLVDQFRASTANDTHPYNYGYRLQYTGQNAAEWDTTKISNVLIVPVKHSGSTLNGFYTFDEMIHDSIPTLLQTNVKNGELTMTLGGDPEIYYYTLMRNPANAWSRITYTQKDNNNTFYTEGMNYLPQYAGAVNYPGDEIERFDNAEVLTGSYNDYMRYTPITWTYGYNRFYYDAEGLPSGLTPDGYHNSYGSPIWKTGVGKVTVNSVEVERQVKNTQTNEDNPATSWKDENGNDCNVYFLGVDATGMLPTTNMKGEGGSNYYEPYMFRVWVKSNSGSLRGYTPMSSNDGDYVVNDPTLDRNMQVVYEEYTNSTTLDKSLPENYINARNIIKFGALKGIQPTDLQVIVRFYYKVKHIDPVDNSMDNMVTIDFTDNPWQIPAGNIASWQTNNTDYTDGNLTIGLANKYFYNENIGFLMLGENGQLTLPTFDRKVKQIQVVGRPGASNTVKMNIFVGNDAVSTEATGSLGTNTFNIDENYQTVGTQYILKVTNAYNAQISKVIVIFEEEETNGFMMRAPKRAGEGTVYEKVTSADQIVAGKKYILVSEDANMALTATASSSRLAGEAVTITDGTVTIGANSSIAEFTLGGSLNAWTLENGGNYLTGSSSTGLSITTSGSYSTWRLNNYNNTLSGYRALNNKDGEATSRAVCWQTTGSCFGNYATSNIGSGTTYSYAWLYVEKEGTTPVTNPELMAPTDGATVNVGTNTGNGVSVPVTISGSDLTENLTVAVSGEGFSVSTNSVDYAAANAGTSVTVTYNGTTANATGTLTISSSEVGTITVNLTATYDGGTTPPEDEPMLIAPVNGSTVFVGTTSAETPSVSQVITVIGDLLTKDLTATITGEGFAFQTRDITIPYADVNAGTASVTVVYSGTDENARGTLTLASDEVSAVVNLTASYRKPVVLSIEPAGYVTQDEATVDEITTGIIETLFEQMRGEVVGVTYVNALGMQSDKPFEGINIVVTRYSDGTTSTSKVRY